MMDSRGWMAIGNYVMILVCMIATALLWWGMVETESDMAKELFAFASGVINLVLGFFLKMTSESQGFRIGSSQGSESKQAVLNAQLLGAPPPKQYTETDEQAARRKIVEHEKAMEAQRAAEAAARRGE